MASPPVHSSITTHTNLNLNPSPAKTHRRAQPWACQFLEALAQIHEAHAYQQRAQAGEAAFDPDWKPDPLPLPHRIELNGAPLELPRGQAIRWSQEVNLAIKQANQLELVAEEVRRVAQLKAMKANKSGANSLPDYPAVLILWRVKAESTENLLPSGEPAYQLFMGFPLLNRNHQRGQSSLANLADSFFRTKMAELNLDTIETAVPRDDVFERMMRGEHLQGDDNGTAG